MEMKGARMGAVDESADESELGFLAAMERYRAVKASGNPADVAEAEEQLRAYVRGELTESCGGGQEH